MQRTRSQAEKIVVWEERNRIGDTIVYVRNTSDMPIFRLRVQLKSAANRPTMVPLRSPYESDTIGPKSAAYKKIDERGTVGIQVRFTAADGKQWSRDAQTGRLTKQRARHSLSPHPSESV